MNKFTITLAALAFSFAGAAHAQQNDEHASPITVERADQCGDPSRGAQTPDAMIADFKNSPEVAEQFGVALVDLKDADARHFLELYTPYAGAFPGTLSKVTRVLAFPAKKYELSMINIFEGDNCHVFSLKFHSDHVIELLTKIMNEKA